eukprot:scaffold2838_cov376-Prasinococcus_capsulatus_cf.AAC.6
MRWSCPSPLTGAPAWPRTATRTASSTSWMPSGSWPFCWGVRAPSTSTACRASAATRVPTSTGRRVRDGRGRRLAASQYALGVI